MYRTEEDYSRRSGRELRRKRALFISPPPPPQRGTGAGAACSGGRGRASSAAACPPSGGRTPRSSTTARRPRTRVGKWPWAGRSRGRRCTQASCGGCAPRRACERRAEAAGWQVALAAAKFARLRSLDWTRVVGLRVSSAGSAPPTWRRHARPAAPGGCGAPANSGLGWVGLGRRVAVTVPKPG